MPEGEQCLKMPKRQSEAVDQRTDNVMAKRKRTDNDLQNIAQKTEEIIREYSGAPEG